MLRVGSYFWLLALKHGKFSYAKLVNGSWVYGGDISSRLTLPSCKYKAFAKLALNGDLVLKHTENRNKRPHTKKDTGFTRCTCPRIYSDHAHHLDHHPPAQSWVRFMLYSCINLCITLMGKAYAGRVCMSGEVAKEAHGVLPGSLRTIISFIAAGVLRNKGKQNPPYHTHTFLNTD